MHLDVVWHGLTTFLFKCSLWTSGIRVPLEMQNLAQPRATDRIYIITDAQKIHMHIRV